MDLIWPEGFEGASSGGEREYELSQILDRIHKNILWVKAGIA